MKAFITNIDYYLPKLIEENPDGRLKKKTGIEKRHISEDNETAADMAIKAAEKLFANGLDKSTIDFVLLCTQSPDYFLPTTACIIQDKLGLNKSCGALDYNLGCSGFIYGLGLAKGIIESNQAKKVLLLTSDTYSKYIDKDDSATRPLFGDAAAAVIIEGKDSPYSGIDGLVYGTDGSGYKNLIVTHGAARCPINSSQKPFLFMNGSEITSFALDVVPATVNNVLQKMKINVIDLDYVVFHQANKFILEFLQEECSLQQIPFYNDVSNYGNTVSASIPIALKDLVEKNNCKELNKVLLVGFGVGLSYGGCVVNLSKMNKFE